MQDKLELQGEQPPAAEAAPGAAPAGAPAPAKPGKYVPPSMRDGGNRRGESMTSNRRGEHCQFFLGRAAEVDRSCGVMMSVGRRCGVAVPRPH